MIILQYDSYLLNLGSIGYYKKIEGEINIKYFKSGVRLQEGNFKEVYVFYVCLKTYKSKRGGNGQGWIKKKWIEIC